MLQRKLSAIMFTDMVGYTALMGQDEILAKSLRKRHRMVLERATAKYAGQIIQYYGDGSLITFDSGVQAAHCAIEIQTELIKEPSIPLRIGIHIGDIAFEDDGVYGEGVNVAARIESLAKPASILISERMDVELQNHPEIETVFLGLYDLKNVKQAVKIFAISHRNLSVPNPGELKGKGELSLKSIAVLPFVNFSRDPNNEFFSDGITEEILNALVRVEGLRVTSRTSSFAFKGKSAAIKEVAQSLGVQTILEGSVRKAGDRVRITAQLINAVEDVHLWSETYDRNIEDIFLVQDEISQKIANKMRAHLASLRTEIKPPPPTHNIPAYELYLKGKFFFNKFTPTDMQKALTYFQDAQELAPDFILPRSHIASIYAFLGAIGVVDAKTAFEKADAAATSALAISDKESDAHVAKALVALFYEWNWTKVEHHLEEAEKSGKVDVIFYMTKSMFLSALGRNEESVQLIQGALPLDPLNPLLRFYYAQGLYYRGSWDAAIRELNQVLVATPDFRTAVELKGLCYHLKGDYANAEKYLLEYQALTGSRLKGWTPVACTYGARGARQKVLEILEKLKERQKIEPDTILSLDFATIYVSLQEHDKALSYLEQACADHMGSMIFLAINPTWAALRNEPRFRRMLKKVGLPQIWDN